MIKQLSFLLTDILNTGNIDYLTDDNTAVVDEHQLPQITPTNLGPGRKLLSSLEADEVSESPATCIHTHIVIHEEAAPSPCPI